MLKKERRLNRSSFNTTRLSRFSYKTPSISLRALCAKGAGSFSVVVPKSVAPKAVDRNLIRRRVYAILRHYGGLQGIIYLHSSKLSYRELSASLKELLEKALGNCKGKLERSP